MLVAIFWKPRGSKVAEGPCAAERLDRLIGEPVQPTDAPERDLVSAFRQDHGADARPKQRNERLLAIGRGAVAHQVAAAGSGARPGARRPACRAGAARVRHA